MIGRIWDEVGCCITCGMHRATGHKQTCTYRDHVEGQSDVFDYEESDVSQERVNLETGEIFDGEQGEVSTAVIPRGLLPEAFWSSRKYLEHIRQAAHSQGCSGEVAFYTVMARLSSLIHHRIKADTGMKNPVSLNIFAAIVGPTAAGKSSGKKAGTKLLQIPDREFRDNLPIGTGEGIAETFMGEVEEATADVDRSGNPVMAKVRKQVRHNAFFYVDEGEVLTKVSGRQGATLGETLRRAANGETLGQTNAEGARNRYIEEGSYSMGMVVGFQPESALPLLDEATLGTPQRFLWSPVTDPSIPARIQDKPDWPGVLDIQPQFKEPPGDLFITFPPEVQQELWDVSIQRNRGEVDVDLLNGHEQVIRIKVAALLALLDHREAVSLEDWALSKMVWDASCSLRNSLVEKAQREAARRKEEKISDHVEKHRRAAAATSGDEVAVKRVGKWIARRVAGQGGMSVGALRKALASRDREWFSKGLDYAAAEGWVSEDGGELTVGESNPIS